MVIGWLTRVTVVLAVLGVLAYDGIAVAVAHVSTDDAANTAASAAVDSWRQRADLTSTYAAAQAALPAGDDLVGGSLSVAVDGSVTLRVHKDIDTLVLRHLPRSADLTEVTAAGSASRP